MLTRGGLPIFVPSFFFGNPVTFELLPILGSACWPFSSRFRSVWAACHLPIDQLDRGFVADCAVRSLLVVVSTSSLAFSSRIVEAHEPMRVQTFRSEFAVERLDEGVVSGLPGREVRHHEGDKSCVLLTVRTMAAQCPACPKAGKPGDL